jgi:hypothetical protein
MAKKIFTLTIFVLFSYQIQAQSSFSIKITQVYPAGGVVFGNNYNLYGDLDKAKTQLLSQYTGKNANYIMELAHPNGKETKNIQNINWILIKNDIKNNLRNKPTFKESYPQPVNIEYYACDIYGKPKSNSGKIEKYDFFYCFYKGKDAMAKNNKFCDKIVYRTETNCRKKANEYFKANKIDSLLCKVIIYNSKGDVVDSTINNQVEYDSFQAVKEDEAKEKKQKELQQDSAKNAKPVYNKQDVEKELKQLLAETNSLKKKSGTYRQDMNQIIDKAEKIVELLEIDSKTFDKNKYFVTFDTKVLKEGLNKLLEINKKKVEPAIQNPPKAESSKPKVK